MIVDAVKNGEQIDEQKLIRMLVDAGPEELKTLFMKHEKLARQLGHTKPKALAVLAAVAGLTLAALPLVSEANQDAYLSAAIKTGKAGMDVMNWWDQNSSGKYRTTANQLLESAGLGDANRAVASYEDKVAASMNEAVPYLGTVGKFATGFVGDVVNELPGLAISGYQAVAEGAENLWNWIKPEEQAPPKEEGLLKNNWT